MKKQVKVCGVNYSIEYLTDGQDKDLRNALGYCDNVAKRIVLDKEQSKDELQFTLRHELLHAFFFECGCCDLAHNEELIKFLEVQLSKIVEVLNYVGALPQTCNNELNMTKTERQRYYANLDRLKEQNAKLLARDGSLNDVLKERFDKLNSDKDLTEAERKQQHATLCSMSAVLKMASWEQIRLLMAMQRSYITKTQIYELIEFCNSVAVAKQHLDKFKDGAKNGKN